VQAGDFIVGSVGFLGAASSSLVRDGDNCGTGTSCGFSRRGRLAEAGVIETAGLDGSGRELSEGSDDTSMTSKSIGSVRWTVGLSLALALFVVRTRFPTPLCGSTTCSCCIPISAAVLRLFVGLAC